MASVGYAIHQLGSMSGSDAVSRAGQCNARAAVATLHNVAATLIGIFATLATLQYRSSTLSISNS
jgi:hypothetical protein